MPKDPTPTETDPNEMIRDYDPEEYYTVSCRVFGTDMAIIAEAALAEGVSMQKYARRLVLPGAYADLKLAPPDFAMYEHPDPIGEAARLLGITPREYAAKAARKVALEDLGVQLPTRAARASEPPPAGMVKGASSKRGKKGPTGEIGRSENVEIRNNAETPNESGMRVAVRKKAGSR